MKAIKASILLIILLQLCGCSYFPNYQTPLEPINPQIVHDRGDGKALAMQQRGYAFRLAYLAATCQKEEDSKITLADTDATCIRNKKALISNYIDTGIAYAKVLCLNHFSQLYITQEHRKHARSETSLIGGVASSILGIVEAPASQIAITGAAFGFGDASFGAYDDAFMLTPNIASLQKLVFQKQMQQEIEIYERLNSKSEHWPAKIETFWQADRALGDYIFQCSVGGMRAALEDSLSKDSSEIKTENDGKTNPGTVKGDAAN